MSFLMFSNCNKALLVWPYTCSRVSADPKHNAQLRLPTKKPASFIISCLSTETGRTISIVPQSDPLCRPVPMSSVYVCVFHACVFD